MATNCQLLKAQVLEFLGGSIRVAEIRDDCVVTLPHKTLDDRFASVFVQQKLPDYFVVHDGGKTAAELYAQGIHLTDIKLLGLEELAQRYGATFVQGTFRIGCAATELSSAVIAISQCAVLATWHVLAHKPSFGEEPVLARIAAGLKTWRAPYQYEVRQRVRVRGKKGQHTFDFVSHPINVEALPISLEVVRPSDNPLEQARGYGFMAYDLEGTIYADWQKIAVITKSEEWSDAALEIVRSFANRTVEVRGGDEDKIERMVSETLTEVAA